MDLDLRRLRYFVAVAETLSFRRAADQLRIAQPVLSRQIRVLERELRAQLFDRGPRGTALTAAGQQLLADAPDLLADSDAVALRARRAAEPARRLVLGVMPGLVVTAAVQAFERDHPECIVEVYRTTWQTQVTLVRQNRVDVSLAREPLTADQLVAVRVAEEPRVAVLPGLPEFATREPFDLAQAAGLLLLQDADAVPEWKAVASDALRERSSRHVPASSVEEKLEQVASGRGFVVLPRSTAEFYRHPNVVIRELATIEPSVVVMVTRPNDDPMIKALTDCVHGAKAQLTGLVPPVGHAPRSADPPGQ